MTMLGGMEWVDNGMMQWQENITSQTQNLLFRAQGMIAKCFVIGYQLLQLYERHNAGFLETQVH